MNWFFIDAEEKILPLIEDLKASTVVALDTEYDSFRYFQPRLCLIQVRTPKKTYLIDPLSAIDLTFLGDYLADPYLLKVLHAGDNDLRLLKRDYNFTFRNIFDTQKAARILGCPRLSLAFLVHTYLGIPFAKSRKLQRSRWDRRPLREEQLHYAVLDTAYLIELYAKLVDEITKKGLEKEVSGLFSELNLVRWTKSRFDEQGYLKIAKNRNLSPQEEERLRRLFFWRYEKARELNRAVFLILSDEELLRLACLKDGEREELLLLLSPEKIARFGSELVQLLKGYGE